MSSGSRSKTSFGAVPLSSPPSSPKVGDIYFDGTQYYQYDGSLWRATLATRNRIMVQQGNGYGSTNNVIRRFKNIVGYSSGVIYVDDPVDGASFKVVVSGLYAVSFTDSFNAISNVGISLNSSNLTTGITNLSDPSVVVGISTTSAANFKATATALLDLVPTDVVRPHNDGDSGSAVDKFSSFTIMQVG